MIDEGLPLGQGDDRSRGIRPPPSGRRALGLLEVVDSHIVQDGSGAEGLQGPSLGVQREVGVQ
jgi:hypothetical protein